MDRKRAKDIARLLYEWLRDDNNRPVLIGIAFRKGMYKDVHVETKSGRKNDVFNVKVLREKAEKKEKNDGPKNNRPKSIR